MRKILLIITTMLSLNAFAGLVHKDVDTRVQYKLGWAVDNHSSYNNGMINNINTLFKTNVYENKDKNFNIYAGGGFDLDIDFNLHFDRRGGDLPIFVRNISLKPGITLNGIVGLEEEHNKDLKFYQQTGITISYKRVIGWGRYTENDKFNYAKLEGYQANPFMLGIPIELGMIYKNYVMSLGLEFQSNIIGNLGQTITGIQLPPTREVSIGFGYQF